MGGGGEAGVFRGESSPPLDRTLKQYTHYNQEIVSNPWPNFQALSTCGNMQVGDLGMYEDYKRPFIPPLSIIIYSIIMLFLKVVKSHECVHTHTYLLVFQH